MAGILTMILAGGEGTRLQPLTTTRSKPSVPFGGSYRLIDFVLNNFVNADFLRIYVLTQFKSQSLYLHMKKGWNIVGITDRFIDPIPAQMRMGKRGMTAPQTPFTRTCASSRSPTPSTSASSAPITSTRWT